MNYIVAHPLVSFVSFTGSVANGKRVEVTAASSQGNGFKSVGLELGGKDAAYVREGECSSGKCSTRSASWLTDWLVLQTRIQHTPLRTLLMVLCSTRVNRAARSSACTCTSRSTTDSSRRLSRRSRYVEPTEGTFKFNFAYERQSTFTGLHSWGSSRGSDNSRTCRLAPLRVGHPLAHR